MDRVTSTYTLTVDLGPNPPSGAAQRALDRLMLFNDRVPWAGAGINDDGQPYVRFRAIDDRGAIEMATPMCEDTQGRCRYVGGATLTTGLGINARTVATSN